MVTKAGAAKTIAADMGLGAIGFLLLTRLSGNGTAWGIIPGTVIVGLGQALVFTTMYIAASTGIEMKEQGIASAIVSTGQPIGGSVGLAAIMAVISLSLGTGAALKTMKPADLNQAIHTALPADAMIAVLGIFIALIALRRRSVQIE